MSYRLDLDQERHSIGPDNVGLNLGPNCLQRLSGDNKSHAREPLYSNSAVIAWCSQSTGAQNILLWFTVIHSMSQYFTAFNFHDFFSFGIIA